mmetsp:Transcript_28741/g.77452  ORF Transcript_28741/g.77452 Transcript_28741/m.77452 type:complete len:82 (-) Transcript_28741:475-720(-)
MRLTPHPLRAFSTFFVDTGSHADVGSSNRSTSGWSAAHTHSITRCAWPPDSSLHCWFSTDCAKPMSWARASKSPLGRPRCA